YNITNADGTATLTLSCSSAPAFVTIDQAGKKLTFTPSNDHVGTHAFSCQASNGVSQSAEILYFSMTVANVNDEPMLSYGSSFGIAGFAGSGTFADPYTVSVPESSPSAAIVLSALDVDLGDTLTISCSNKPSWVTIDQANAKLTLAPTA